MKKSWFVGASMALLLVACQEEQEAEKQEVKKVESEEVGHVEQGEQEQKMVSAEEDFATYEWKTNYALVLNQYISAYGFLDLQSNPFYEGGSGVISAKLVTSEERAMPYLAVLYVPNDQYYANSRLIQPEEELSDGVFFDIWDVQNGQPVRIKHEAHRDQGTASDLALAFVETADRETLLRYTSENDGPTYVYHEDFYQLSNLQTPVYRLDYRGHFEEGATYSVNEEVSESEYEKMRERLNTKEMRWIDSNIGSKSIAEEVAPVISTVLAVFKELDTEGLHTPAELSSLEKEAMFSSLRLFGHLEEGLTDLEKLEFVNGYHGLPGRTTTEANDVGYFSKEVIDYYSASNFGFTLDETAFASEMVDNEPAYKNGTYLFPLMGDAPLESSSYEVDLLNVEKLEDSLYVAQFKEALFSYAADDDSIPTYTFFTPISQWPQHLHEFMYNERTKYALFEKNQYGYALLEVSPKPLTGRTKAEAQPNADKEVYIASLDYAHTLAEQVATNEQQIAAHDAWDAELNKIYGMLREKLSADQMEQLKLEQRKWLKIRDLETGNLNEGIDEVSWGYRTEFVMERTYFLIDLYFD